MLKKNKPKPVKYINMVCCLGKINYLSKAGYFLLLCCLFSFLPINFVFGQTDSLTRITQQFAVHRQQNLQEKLFMHLDRPMYVCGETMWFKLYVVEGASNKPLDLSKVAYVEVVSQ